MDEFYKQFKITIFGINFKMIIYYIMKIFRIDLFFSIWILAWYILYMFEITIYNPKIWIIFILFGIFIICCILLYNKKYISLLIFIAFNIIIKVIPLWTILNTPIIFHDFFVGLFLFIIYNFWLLYNNETLYTVYNKLTNSLLYDKEFNTSIMYFLNSIKI
jgi:hypothetical protein